jgi:hypothetical protein
MSSAATMIAVSEMIGVPVEKICGYLIIAVTHEPEGHRPHVVPSDLGFLSEMAPSLLQQILTDHKIDRAGLLKPARSHD